MTTLVWDERVMAADTRCIMGNGWIMSGSATKLARLSNGGIAGIMGNRNEFAPWLEASDSGRPLPELKDGTAIVTIQATAEAPAAPPRIRVYENAGWFDVTAPFYAWGSGGVVALGALYAGASAVRAVEIAMLVDNDTGGNVESMQLEPLR